MKKFKELGLAFIAIIACISMTACNSDIDAPASDEELDVYTVQLGWGGELDVTYEPLSRATTDDLYGIQVYSAPEKGESTTWTPYAYGLFNSEDITINLLKGYKYKFVATMVVDGKNNIYNAGGYWEPFHKQGDGDRRASLTNKFEYQSSTYFMGLSSGYTTKSSNTSIAGPSYYRPDTDRYYGELEEYIPGEKNAKAKIKMKRASFGAKFIAKGKAADSGTLEIQIAGAPKMELTPSTDKKHISETFTFDDVKAAWEANGNYSETISVTINWHRTDGTTIPLGTHEIAYKRNATTVVQVNVVNDNSDEGIGYEIDETELGEMPENEDVTNIEDGKIVETEVDTNK